MSSEHSVTTADELPSATTAREFDALQRVIAALTPFSPEDRRRILESASLFLQVGSPSRIAQAPRGPEANFTASSSRAPFSEDTSMSPKEFLLEKEPRTDVERIATLAYYLTHYRGTPHFKTFDLSSLNTEAAQPRFANAANSSNNAVKMGYLVPSTKGQRQLSAIGERFVRALPNREAAKLALETNRRKPRTKRARTILLAEEA